MTDPLDAGGRAEPLEVPAVVGSARRRRRGLAGRERPSRPARPSGQVVVWTVDESRRGGAGRGPRGRDQARSRTSPSAPTARRWPRPRTTAPRTVYALQGDLAPRQLPRAQHRHRWPWACGQPRLARWSRSEGPTTWCTSGRLDGSAPQEPATPGGVRQLRRRGGLLAGRPDARGRQRRRRRCELWDVTSPAAPGPLGGPLVGAEDTVLGLAFDTEGERLAAASADGTLSLWTLGAGRRHAPTRGSRSLGGGVYQVLLPPVRPRRRGRGGRAGHQLGRRRGRRPRS